MKLVSRILNSNKGMWRFVGFALASVVGLAVILGAYQIYRDAAPLLTSPDSFMRGDYVILSKKVGALQVLGIGNSDFKQAEIDEIARQGFVLDAGVFTPAAYRITGTVSMGDMSMSSMLFFESVPDGFLDVRSGQWGLDTVSKVIPIVIPRNYLNLYNYGFSRSQGLPQVSEELFGAVTIDLRLSGTGGTDHYKGRIVGFSDRLNTILVPQAFMEWSNHRFGDGTPPAISRVIAEVTDAGSDELEQWLASKGYETEGESAGRGTAAYFLRVITAIVIGVGLIITVLAFFLLILGVYLVLQKNSEKLRELLLLGFSARQVSAPYIRMALSLNLASLVIALGGVVLMRSSYIGVFGAILPGYEKVPLASTVILGIAVTAVTSAVTLILIRRKVNAMW